jgi:hypothetical protein
VVLNKAWYRKLQTLSTPVTPESDSIRLDRRCRRCCHFHKHRKKKIPIDSFVLSQSSIDAMNNEKMIPTSQPVFRKQRQGESGGQMLPIATNNRDSSSIVIATLKTFSCDSDTDLIDDIFDSQSYFATTACSSPSPTATSENGTTIPTKQELSQEDQRTEDLMPHPPNVITPPKSCTTMVEISLDPSPESLPYPFLVQVGTTTTATTTSSNGATSTSDDLKSPLEKEESGLLFPSSDPDCPTTTTPGYRSPMSFINSHHAHAHAHAHDYHANVARNNNDDTLIMTSNLCETDVYKQLQPSFPLPESFRPILYLLLHIEFSSTIHGTVLNDACGIMNEEWKQEEAHDDELCNSTSTASTTSNKRSSIDGRKIQNISGKIVDVLVETLGPTIDLPGLFQASARTYNNLAATDGDGDGDRLSMFFQKGVTASSKPAEKTAEFQATIDDKVAIKSCPSEEVSTAGCVYECPAVGQKRKMRTNDDDDDEKIIALKKNRIEFVPNALQLGIAYGATTKPSTNDGIKSDQGISLENFVTKTSSRLHSMDPFELKREWNSMMKAWEDR